MMRTRMKGGVSARWLAGALGLAVLAHPAPTSAQTPFVPYYGKNIVRYKDFEWKVYKTDHFEIYYYPDIEKQLERVSSYAESAYQQVSSDLKHDLAFKVPLIIFKTHSEFEQENVIPGAAQEGVAAFAESDRNRMLLPLDEPPDLLFRTITHELTHIFQFDIIPQGLIRRNMPLWVSEGNADYETGYWAPLDLMTVRDAAVADIVPKMSDMQDYGNFNNPRLVYNLGHAVFEFIESKWGKEGVRQFMFSLRKNVIGGGDNAYEDSLKLAPEDFDQQFEKYLKDRFKPFRDKERPVDYGKDLAPKAEKTHFSNALSAEPSPSGDLIAVVTGNRSDREYDIILVSTKDGSVIRNLTSGFDKDMHFDHIVIPGTRWNTVPWMTWSPSGDRLAYFARTEDYSTLILQNVLTRKIEVRVPLKTVNAVESPAFAPGGRVVAFSAMRDAKSDLYAVNLDTLEVSQLTNDEFFNYAPTYSPDGKYLVYMARVSGNEKLFKLDLETKKRIQLTFGTYDDGSARFLDADTIIYPSTATDPSQSIDPDIARNGNIYNLWTLNLKSGELRQYTDALTGNVNPVPLKGDTKSPRVAFITYYKGDYGLHTIEPTKPLHTAASADFGAPGPIIDFQAPLSHTLINQNVKKKGRFEKLFLDGRPPVSVGITSGGNIFGGTDISFADVLGDQRFNFYAASISQYRSFAFSWVNLSHRFQYALQGFWQTDFYYGQTGGVFYDPIYNSYIDLNRSQALSTRTTRGGTAYGIYPLNTYQRIEVSAGAMQYKESFQDQGLQDYSNQYQQQVYGRQLLQNGTMVPLGLAFVQETTVFREFGPLAGNTVRLNYEIAPKIGNTLSRQSFDADLRYYKRLAGSALVALRWKGFKGWGRNPGFTYFGGNSEMHGYQYLEFIGQNATFGNAELRFPIIEAMLTPIGVLGGIRGMFFLNVGGAWFADSGYKFVSTKDAVYTPIVGETTDPVTGLPSPTKGNPMIISGFRLVDSRASYGLGLETFLLGFPLHFEWSWKTLFNRSWEDLLFASSGGSSAFRKPKFSVWIGYDF
jgi:hypothetical protein